jgi:hypothetical protein
VNFGITWPDPQAQLQAFLSFGRSLAPNGYLGGPPLMDGIAPNSNADCGHKQNE